MNPLLSPQAPLTQLQKDVANLLSFPATQLQIRLTDWKNAFRLIWKNSDSTSDEVLAALGTNAANLFQLSALEVTYLEQLSPGCTTDTLSLLKPCTVNPDGTVTLSP